MKLIIVAVLGCASAAFAQSASNGTIFSNQIGIDTTDLSNWLPPTEVDRAVGFAVASYPDIAGSRWLFEVWRAGDFSESGKCETQIGPVPNNSFPHITAGPICGIDCPACNCTWAGYVSCGIAEPNYGYIRLNKNMPIVTTLPYPSSVVPPVGDLQAIILHEMMHVMGRQSAFRDVSIPTCATDPYTAAPRAKRRYLCGADITSSDVMGFNLDSAKHFSNPNINSPTGTAWTGPLALGAGAPMGSEASDFRRTLPRVERGIANNSVDRDSFFYIRTQPSTFATVNTLYDFNFAWGHTDYTGPPVTRRPPTTLYDWVSGKWWGFYLVDEDPSTYPYDKNEATVQVWLTRDRLSWTNLGPLRDSYDNVVRTRMPVAATVDPRTNNIVVAWNNYDNSSVAEYGQPCFQTARPFGCTEEINIMILNPNPVGLPPFGFPAAVGSPFTFSGKMTVGTPLVSCQQAPDVNDRQCEIIFVSTDGNRTISSFNFGIRTMSGGAPGVVPASATTSLDGATYYTMSIANPPATTGRVVLVVKGTDGVVYARSKGSTMSAWGGWAPLAISGGGSVRTKLSPVIRQRLGIGAGYEMVVLP